MSIHIQTHKSPVGELLLGEYNDQLVLADWKYRQKRIQVDERLFKRLNTTYAKKKNPYTNPRLLNWMPTLLAKEPFFRFHC